MFENEKTVFCKQVIVENEIRNLWQILKGVRRVCEDEVELQVAALYEFEHIACYQVASLVAKFLEALTDEASMIAVFFHADNLLATAREQFKRDAAGAGKEVEGYCFVEIHIASYHIEYVLLGKISCRSCLESAWHIEMTAFVFSCYYAHIIRSKLYPQVELAKLELINFLDEFAEKFFQVVHEENFAR